MARLTSGELASIAIAALLALQLGTLLFPHVDHFLASIALIALEAAISVEIGLAMHRLLAGGRAAESTKD